MKYKITESQLNRVVKESVNRVLREHRFMSDEDIAAQYDDMIITYFEIKPLRYGDGWSGTFELEFPNADNIDYESTMVNGFITYDKEGKRISWDKWMPDKQTMQLTKIIRNEIKKKLNNIINEIGDTPKGQYMLGRLQRRDGGKTWRGSWVADDERIKAAEKTHEKGGSYDAKYNNLLNAYRDGRNGKEW